jgi:cytochrome c peroxidase
MRNSYFIFLSILLLVIPAVSCRDDSGGTQPKDDHQVDYFDIEIPFGFPKMQIPENNKTSREGVELGRMLYYERALHPNGTFSCASCHVQSYGFTTPETNVMPHINLAWNRHFLWDGRIGAQTLEEINLFEVEDFFGTDISKLQNHPDYPGLFKKAFGSSNITSINIAKALSQYMRTMVSGNSDFDKFLRGEIGLTDEQYEGMEIFMSEPRTVTATNIPGGDCFHCHGTTLFTSGDFHNIGLDFDFSEPLNHGRFGVTGDSSDMGRWKAPTLRNVAARTGFMHDNRFSTLEEVIEFYNTGGHLSQWIDPFMKSAGKGGLMLTEIEKQKLIAFLHALTDHEFLNNPELSDPFD